MIRAAILARTVQKVTVEKHHRPGADLDWDFRGFIKTIAFRTAIKFIRVVMRALRIEIPAPM